MFALDPLLFDKIDLSIAWRVGVKVLVAFVVVLLATAFMIWFERKIIADLQNRVGPSVAGPWGLLQVLADGVKLFFKEDIIPDQADRFVFKLAPFLTLVPAFVTFSVIPLMGDFTNGKDGTVSLAGKATYIQLADPQIGILLLLAMSSIAVYGVMLAGWSSGSKYPLLGSVRASAQMISYEAALGMSVAAVILATGTLSTHGMVVAQDSFLKWNVWATGVVPMFIFIVAATAELNRPPFDLVEAEQELVGGFMTEYSAARFAMFYLAEFLNTVTMSGIIVTLFLGGPRGAFDIPGIPNGIESLLWFLVKLLALLFMYVWFRATLPRLRYDQLMDLGWKVLIPLSFGWLLVLVSFRVSDAEGWSRPVVFAIDLVVMTLSASLFYLALRASAKRRQLEGASF